MPKNASDIFKKIRKIQIHATKLANEILAGPWHSAFKGQGMEFEEVREYQSGDDIRNIDWNVTARMGHPYVKRYVEERELTILFLVDLSASGAFGSIDKTKNEVAAELCALLSFSAVKNNDKVGLIAFTDHIEMFIPPKKGVSHALRLIRDLLNFRPRKTKTNITEALDYLGRITHKKCVVFLISDFQCEGFEKQLRVLGRLHDLIAISVSDPKETDLPNVGILELEDAETGERVVIDTGSAAVRKEYEKMGKIRTSQLRDLFRSMKIDHTEVITGQDYVKDLVRFFRSRERRR